MKRIDITAIFPDATEEQIKAVMDLNGNDINTAKGSLDQIQKRAEALSAENEKLAKASGEYEKERQRAESLLQELTDLKAANEIREMRDKVATATGVPISLLTGGTEEECTAQANAIKEYAKPSIYPAVRDGGEPGGVPKASTRQQFADWFNQLQ